MNNPESTPTDAPNEWWFYADSRNQTAGPVTVDQLRQLLVDGTITSNTHVCEPGRDNWRKLSDAILLQGLASPPSLPSSLETKAPPISLRSFVKDMVNGWRKFAEARPGGTGCKWFQRTGTILASSAICFPVSLALIWTSRRFKVQAQVALSFVCLFVIPFCSLVGLATIRVISKELAPVDTREIFKVAEGKMAVTDSDAAESLFKLGALQDNAKIGSPNAKPLILKMESLKNEGRIFYIPSDCTVRRTGTRSIGKFCEVTAIDSKDSRMQRFWIPDYSLEKM